MSNLIDILTLQEKINFHGTREELELRINTKNGEYSTKWISKEEFKFFANFSFGTFEEESSNSKGIEGYGHIVEIKDELFEIELKTKIKSGLKIYLVFFAILIFIEVVTKQNISIWGYLLAVGVLIFFMIIVRVQENYLFEAIKFELKRK